MKRKSCNHPVKFKAKRSRATHCDKLTGSDKKECLRLESHYATKRVKFRTKCGKHEWTRNQKAARAEFRKIAKVANKNPARKVCGQFKDKNRKQACLRNTWGR